MIASESTQTEILQQLRTEAAAFDPAKSGNHIAARFSKLFADAADLIERLTTERKQLQSPNAGLAERVAKQAECLSRKAERTVTDG